MSGIKYRIEYEIGIKEKLKKFPKNIQTRIIRAIEERLTISPNDCGKPLRREWRDFRRLRVGDYRVIYRVIDEKIIVFIIEIDHRKDVYDE